MRIGKYATENGPTKAAAHFSKVLDCKINESTARKFKCEYLNEIEKMVHDDYQYDGKLVVSGKTVASWEGVRSSCPRLC